MSNRRKEQKRPAATLAEDRLKLARVQVENVLWNLRHDPTEPLLRDPEAWQRVFEDLQRTLG
jgi:hypothetical protein